MDVDTLFDRTTNLEKKLEILLQGPDAEITTAGALYDRTLNLERKLETLLQGSCARPECARARALLRERPPTQLVPESIERVRAKRMGIVWMVSLVVSLFWAIVCLQKGYVTLALVNFVVAFLPLWRSLYVDTPFYMTLAAWGSIVGTTVMMLRGGGDL